MTLFQLYLLTRLNPLIEHLNGAVFCLGIATVATFFCIVFGIIEDEKEVFQVGLKWFKNILVLISVITSITILIPSQKDAFIIMGGYYATNNKQIQQLPDNILAATNEFLKEYAEPIKTQAKEVVKQQVKELTK